MEQHLYSLYDPFWRATEVLGGCDATGEWRTRKAKAYPSRMCEAMSKAYLDFFAQCSFFESTESPQELSQALGALPR